MKWSSISDVMGQYILDGMGQYISDGMGQYISDGMWQYISDRMGQYISDGMEQYISDGMGQYISDGMGKYISNLLSFLYGFAQCQIYYADFITCQYILLKLPTESLHLIVEHVLHIISLSNIDTQFSIIVNCCNIRTLL